MSEHLVVSRAAWLEARIAHLAREKQLTRQRDALAAERRALPWVRVDKTYLFDTPEGERSLADLFDGRSQLVVKHFMMGPGWQEGCVGCSFEVDHIEGALRHLENHDVRFVAVARAPLAEIERFKARMGWRFRWVSSEHSDFNYDYHVSFSDAELATGTIYYNYRATPSSMQEHSGFSVFVKDDSGSVFHTYSSYGRGGEEVLGTYMILDMTPKGRNETGPNFDLTDWVRHHDRYGALGSVDATGRFVAAPDREACCAAPAPRPADVA